MNQEKTGKLIAHLRKKENLTQEQLGEKLGITGKSVSKWERGINAPDISLLRPLSEILNTSVIELLDGEEKDNKKEITNQKELDNTIINGITMYKNKYLNRLKKIVIILLIVTITICISSISLYTLNNYEKIKMYNLYTENKNIELSGNLIIDPYNNTIVISEIFYNDKYVGTNKEIKAKAVKVSIESKNKTLIEQGSLDAENYSLKNLNEHLLPIRIIHSSSINDEPLFQNKEIEDLYIVISYVNELEEIHQLKNKITIVKQFENNKIIYN